jgi:hypothetical protein
LSTLIDVQKGNTDCASQRPLGKLSVEQPDMKKEIPLPPPFIVGEKYEDEIGEYTVVSADGYRMTFRRADGTLQHSDNVALKANIHKRRLSEREHPRPLNYQPSKPSPGAHVYHDDEVTWMVARCIDQLAKRSKSCIPHKKIVECLLKDPETLRIIDGICRLSADHKTSAGRAGQIIARFSFECYQGKWPDYKRVKMSGGHCWRVERR